MRNHRTADPAGWRRRRLAAATVVAFLALGLHQGALLDLSFLNPLHLQGCGGGISYLRSSSIPAGTEKRMVLVGQEEGSPDLRIFRGAQVMVGLDSGSGQEGPFFLGGYLPARDVLILGDRLGSLREIPVADITRLTVVHPNAVHKGAEDGALYGGLTGAALLAALALGSFDGEEASSAAFGLGTCGGLLGSGAGAIVGAVVGSGSVYDEAYAIGPEGWAIAYEASRKKKKRVQAGRSVAPAPAPAPLPGGVKPVSDRCAVAANYKLKRPIGCPCEARDQCATSHCLPLRGVSVCTQVCTTECPAGFFCKPMTGSVEQGLCVRQTGDPE